MTTAIRLKGQMTEEEKWRHLVELDEDLLRGGVVEAVMKRLRSSMPTRRHHQQNHSWRYMQCDSFI